MVLIIIFCFFLALRFEKSYNIVDDFILRRPGYDLAKDTDFMRPSTG